MLLSLREDTLASLDRLKADIPQLFSNVLRLDRLDRAAGRAAIVGPLRRWNELEGDEVVAEEALVERVLDGVGVGPDRARPGRGRGRRGERSLRCASKRRTSSSSCSACGTSSAREDRAPCGLRRCDELGGAGEVVADHLERAIDALGPEQEEIAARLFDHLVTPSGTKIAHEMSDLATFAGASQDAVSSVVETLARPSDPPQGRVGSVGDLPRRPRRRRPGLEDPLRGKARRGARPRRSTPTASSAWLPRLRRARCVGRHHRARRLRVLPAQRRARSSACREGRPAGRQRSVAAGERSGARAGARESRRRAVDPTPQAEDALRDALAASRERAIVDVGHPLVSLELDRTGSRALVVGADSVARLIDLRGGDEAWSHPVDGTAAAFAPDDRSVHVVHDRSLAALDAETGAPIGEPKRLRVPGAVERLVVSPDGATAIVIAGKPRARVVALATGARSSAG